MESKMDEQLEGIARDAVDSAYMIHRELGPGLLETVYEVVLARELERRGHQVRRQVPVPIVFQGLRFDEGFRADLIVDDRLLIEVKSVEEFAPVHGKQVLTYLRLLNFRLGLLINFWGCVIQKGRETDSELTVSLSP
jgi:GxxExxY protein